MASFSPVSSTNENTSQTEISSSSFRSQDFLEGNYHTLRSEDSDLIIIPTSFSTAMNMRNQFLHCNHASVEEENYENAPLGNGSILPRSSSSPNEPLEEDENEQIPFWEKALGNQAFLEGNYENSLVDNFQCQLLVPFPSSSGDVLIPESIESEALVQESCGVLHSSNDELPPLCVSVPTNEQILVESGTSLRTQSSSEEKCDPHNVHSVLVSGSAMCLDLDDIKSHVRVIIEKKLDEHIPLSVSAPRNSIVKDYQRTSKYHGVTRHFWTGKFEAHLWDNSYIREGQRRKGKQVFLEMCVALSMVLVALNINYAGQYDIEEKAGRAYDLAALKYWGPSACTRLNFPISNYKEELGEMNHMSREEFVMYIRRKSSFKIGSSIYRGVTRHGDGRWQARISGIPGKRGLHLGTFGSEEEAAKAYDIASIKFRGIQAYTNFDVSNYCQVDFKELEGQPAPKKLKKNLILASSTTAVSKSNPQPDLTCTRS